MATSFSGGGSQSTRREPPTMGKQLVNFYHLRLRVEWTFFVLDALPLNIAESGFKHQQSNQIEHYGGVCLNNIRVNLKIYNAYIYEHVEHIWYSINSLQWGLVILFSYNGTFLSFLRSHARSCLFPQNELWYFLYSHNRTWYFYLCIKILGIVLSL